MRFICSHDEDSRCHRLLRVLQFVNDLGTGLDVFSLEALEDHKGGLVVHWGGIRPTDEQRTLFHVAWAHVGDEPYDNVEHVTPTTAPGIQVDPGKVFTHGHEMKCAGCGKGQLHMLSPIFDSDRRHGTLLIPFMCELCEGFTVNMCSGKGLVEVTVQVPASDPKAKLLGAAS